MLGQPHPQLFLIFQRTVAQDLPGYLVSGQIIVCYELFSGLLDIGSVLDESLVLVDEDAVAE
ncbi:MAG: hypothetical protein J6U30_08835, partial [Oscillospiraceae bacterium]|nr:hypothetical protein [Oscillospiraceae bacterium]